VSPDLVFADRRGGGRLGFGLSSSCSSLADTKDDGEDAFSLLSMDSDMESRLCKEEERVTSSDLGRD
jgi:hypothetical protein